MNTLITTHEVISQFELRKVLQYWGTKKDNHVYFMLAPQWIKFNPAAVFTHVLKAQKEKILAEQDRRQQIRENLGQGDSEEGKSNMGMDDQT